MKKVYIVTGYFTYIKRNLIMRVYTDEQKAKEYAKHLLKVKDDYETLKDLKSVNISIENVW